RTLGRKKLFPNNWFDVFHYDIGFLAPGLKELVLSRKQAVIRYYGASDQIIQVRWYKPGFGGYRPVGVCQCGRTAFRFYKLHQKLYCKKCCGGLYASQAGDTTSRPHIALTRLKSFISSLPKRTFAQTYRRLEAKHKALEAKLPPGYSLHSK